MINEEVEEYLILVILYIEDVDLNFSFEWVADTPIMSSSTLRMWI